MFFKKKRKNEDRLHLEYYKCIYSNKSCFIKGKCYPVISYNNGLTLLGEKNKDDYAVSDLLHNFGDELHDPEKYMVQPEDYIFQTIEPIFGEE